MKRIFKVVATLVFLFAAGQSFGQAITKKVDAGSDQSVALAPATVTLKGTHSLGDVATFEWTMESGPAPAEIASPNLIKTDVKFKRTGLYTFRFTVKSADGKTSETDDVDVEIVQPGGDERSAAEITAYLGTVFDNFIAAEQRKYLNTNLAEVSGRTDARLLFGFDANFRLVGKNSSPRQLWFFLETLHGVRSADVDCTDPDKDKRPAVCQEATLGNAGAQAHYILRNATSLEGFAGFRFEFLPLQKSTDHPLSLYAKGQLGFMSIAKNPGDIIDNHFVGLGLMATAGRFQGSYFDAGYGRTDLYNVKRLDRWKYDAYMTFQIHKKVSWIKPFAQMTVDSDFGGGADSIQSYIGFDFDVGHLFK